MANINICIGSRLRKNRSRNELDQIERDAEAIARYIYKYKKWRFSNDLQIALAEVPCDQAGGKTTFISFQVTWCNSGTKKTRSCDIFKSNFTINRKNPNVHDYHGFSDLKQRLKAGTLHKILS